MTADEWVPGTLPGDVLTVHRMRGGTLTKPKTHIWRGGAPDCGAKLDKDADLDKWSRARVDLCEWDEWDRAVNCPGCLAVPE
ncbi:MULTISPECIES: hypothetical protein [unclassified Streptomyces]|uniref:hypothetical protein n=1 Tax=Streptomyces sp. NPDC056835 TaxID=3345956 RepID=UPI0036B47018